MASPYLGQIESFPYGFAPKGWAFCAGQLLSIQQNAHCHRRRFPLPKLIPHTLETHESV